MPDGGRYWTRTSELVRTNAGNSPLPVLVFGRRYRDQDLHRARHLASTVVKDDTDRLEAPRGVRKTLAGHYLVCRKCEHEVEELDANGAVIREIPVPGDVHECVLLPDSRLLIACGDGHRVEELDEQLRVVWKLDENELPGHPLRLMSGFQRLQNGNTVFCNYLGHGHLGEQPHLFEITREKKIVWEFADHVHFKVINQVQLLDIPGDVTAGEILR